MQKFKIVVKPLLGEKYVEGRRRKEGKKKNNAKFSGHYVCPRTQNMRAHALRSHLNHEEGSTLEKDPGDNFKTEQTSNHDDSADDGSEESIVVSKSNLSNDEVTTNEDTSTTDNQASKGDLISTLKKIKNQK